MCVCVCVCLHVHLNVGVTELKPGIGEHEVGLWDKGTLRIHVIGLIVSGSENSETFLCGNRCRSGTMSKLKGPQGLDAEHPETMAYWEGNLLQSPWGRKEIGNAEASQDIHSYCPFTFLITESRVFGQNSGT